MNKSTIKLCIIIFAQVVLFLEVIFKLSIIECIYTTIIIMKAIIGIVIRSFMFFSLKCSCSQLYN